ncbi:hypothetical protein RN001_007653 [Aquatica leii]|uniref:Vacuolar protein sorting-associated protein VTA1 homolog n=1 Tax=Aquatica leii TaxID=1421715 RepID=A0AAN7P8L8_9COLE|nr:hypothetical protein RN001_007653 [Aquatica leii]
MPNFPPIPPQIKHVAHFMKVAEEHDERNVVISYWSRMYACEAAMKSISGKKPPEVTQFLVSIMEWLEVVKKEHADLDGIINPTVGHALVEEYALQLFNYADSQDKAEKFGKNVVKAFYTSGILMDILQQFGQLPDEMFNKRKYAKWKAAYIHNCLKLGEQPFSGPPVARNLLEFSDEEDDDEEPAPNLHPEEPINPIPPHSEPVDQPTINFPSNPVPILPPAPPTIPNKEVPVPAPRTNSVTGVTLQADQIEKAQKYCKWAGSALTYDDVNTAINNLQKALSLLQTGRED